MSDTEAEIVDESILEPNLPAKSKLGIIERWLDGEKTPAIEKIDGLVAIIEKLTAASIRLTVPSDWLLNVSRDRDGNILREVGYLQDCGAERAGKIWGVDISSPEVRREDFEDGTFAYHFTADAISRTSGLCLEDAIGSRWSGDPFFQKGLGDGEKVNPVKVQKAAYSNLHGRVVRSLCGLNAVPPYMLAANGIEITKVQVIDYGAAGKGGSSTGVGGADTINFGNAKGTKISELADKDLGWYIKAVTESVASDDPKKVKFKRHNEALLAKLQAEADRRKNAGAQEKETGTADLGKRRTATYKRIQTALPEGMALGEGFNVVMAMIGSKAKGVGELTAEELGKLEAVTDEAMAAELKEIAGMG